MYTVQQAASCLNTSASLVYALCAHGRLQHYRVGLGRGTIRISEEALQELLQESSPAGTRRKRTAGQTSPALRHLKLKG